MTKYLIINADDFGMSFVFSEVILDLIKKDLIRSTTVMVNRIEANQKEQVNELASLSKAKNISVGLHLEFEKKDYIAQINEQYQKFRELFGFYPTHLDIHKAHGLVESFNYVAEFCRSKNIPLRNLGDSMENLKTTAEECFFGSKKDFKEIESWIKTLKDEKYYEILFHPGKFDPTCKSSLNKEREEDTENIILLNKILEENNIKLASYLDL